MNFDKTKISLKINDDFYLRILKDSDIKKNYIMWLNDYEITKHTEQKYIKHNKNNVVKFVNSKFNSKTDYLFGIFNQSKHIGNVKLGSIIWEHKSAHISYLIGIKEYWGKGIATLAVSKVIEFATEKLGIEKINAGYDEPNIASGTVLLKCGFKIEGKRLQNVIFEGKRIDSILLGYFKKNRT